MMPTRTVVPPRIRSTKLWITAEIIVWLIRGPLLLLVAIKRGLAAVAGACVLARLDTLTCPGCDTELSLLGRWQCGWCSYIFDGYGFARCSVCGAVPPFLECQHCGHGVQNPMRIGAGSIER
jgi:hypothetical protein